MMRSRVGEICRERGVTMCRVATACGLSPDTLYGWERRGMDRAQLGPAMLVAGYLGVSVVDLVEAPEGRGGAR